MARSLQSCLDALPRTVLVRRTPPIIMLKSSLQLKLGQQLTMTPQLQEAIRLLQLPILDLRAHIQAALDENVMLEAEEDAAADESEVVEPPRVDGDGNAYGETAFDGTDDQAEPVVAAEAEWEDTQRTGPTDAPRNFEPPTFFEYADRSEETLRDHLLWQLELANADPRTTAIGQAVIDAVNDDGYLTDDLETICRTLAPDVVATPDEVEQVLVGLVQQFEPTGVGARTIAECIRLQLEQLDTDVPGRALALAVVAEHLPLLADADLVELAGRVGVSVDDLDVALGLVKACHPRPGAAVYAPAAEYVVPDVFVRRREGQWIVELNNAMSPQLRVNQLYAGCLGRGDEYDALKVQLQEARWLIRSLEIRNETLLKVALTIVHRQAEFFEHGEERMRPMVLRDVAESIGMHESTVSRVTTRKYMHTPRGIFEFRYFFSSRVAAGENVQSSTAVRAKIRKLVSSEDPDKPVSDSQIAEMLSADGIVVARRTVAKYREALKISSSSDRKRRSGRVGGLGAHHHLDRHGGHGAARKPDARSTS
jgi:RNA polymerase sigma-54 factor